MKHSFLDTPSMNWIKPEFEEIALNMEVTAYVNAGN
jgi:coenzyme PQQ precursor peptide PqqA